MTDIVNGKEVDYLYVQQTADGFIVEFSEKFNVADAHMGVIHQRLRNNGVYCQVFKDLKYNLITILYRKTDDIIPILHSLNIPMGAYEVNEEDNFIYIDTRML